MRWPKVETLEEKLIRRRKIENDCWVWTGYRISTGYASVLWTENGVKKNMLVHRASHELWIGPIPEGYEVDHLCRNRPCYNPKHLEAVTHEENTRRRTWSGPVCRNGHEFTDENTYYVRTTRHCKKCRYASAALSRKLKKQQIEKIRQEILTV
jgi:hypothetical protein